MRIVLHSRSGEPAIKTEYSVVDKLFLLLVFLGAINFVNRDNVLFFLAGGFALLAFKRPAVSVKIVPLLAFSASLLLFWDYAHQTVTTLLSVFTYPICFFCGYNFLRRKDDRESKEHALFALILILTLGALAHMALNAYISRGIEGNRNTDDFWSGEMRSATGQAGLGLLAVGISAGILFSDMRTRYKLAAAGAMIFVLWYDLVLAGRTLVLVAILSLAVSFLYRLFVIRKKNTKTLRAVLISVAVIAIVYSTNLLGIRDTILESNLYQRFTGDYAQGITEDGRSDTKLKFLRYLLMYPFGGGNIRNIVGGYAHDLYLDTYDEAGVFAFFSIVVMIVQSLFVGYRFLRSPRFSHNIKLVVLCAFLCFHLYFFAEPIMAGADWLLMFYCFFYGALTFIMESPTEDLK